MKKTIWMALAFLAVIWMPLPASAGAVSVGEPVIVTEFYDSYERRMRPHPVCLSLGVVQDTGGNQHYVQMYESICQGGGRCGFYLKDARWVESRFISKTGSQNAGQIQGTLNQKGFHNGMYDPCQLNCILFYLKDAGN